ncbi:MAG: outer membrane protein [Flavobacteriaceae bacterium]|jgi:outer membrane protein
MNKLLITSIMSLLIGAVWSQQSFSLSEAKAYALEHNISVRNALQDEEATRQQYIEFRGMGLPQVDINGSFSNFINLPIQVVDASFLNPNAAPGETISFRAGTEFTASGTLQASQLVFNGSYIVGLKAAEYLQVFQSNATLISKEDVVFNVIQAYQLTAVAKENLIFADTMVIITQELIDKQMNYLELGLMKQEEMDQLNYSLLMTKDANLSAELQYKNALSLLKYSMGYPMENEINISEETQNLLNQSALSSNDGSYTQNLTYTLIEKQVGLSELDVKNNRFANLPSLNAFFQHTYNAYRNEFNFFADQPWFPQTVWGLQLNVPVFSGFTRQARTAQARIRLLKNENLLDQMTETLKFQSMQAQNNLAGARSKYKLQEDNIALATSIYNQALTKEQIGEGNSILVTQKYNQIIMAQAQYTASMIELFKAQLSLDKIYNNILPTE